MVLSFFLSVCLSTETTAIKAVTDVSSTMKNFTPPREIYAFGRTYSWCP